MILAVPAYLVGAALTPAIVGMFAVKYTGYGFIGILYGVIAAAALLISASGFPRKNKYHPEQIYPSHPSKLFS